MALLFKKDQTPGPTTEEKQALYGGTSTAPSPSGYGGSTKERAFYNPDNSWKYNYYGTPAPSDGGGTQPHPGDGTQNPDGPSVEQPSTTDGPFGPVGGSNIWDPIAYGDDIMDFNTQAPNPGAVPQFPWFTGDGGPNVTTQTPGADSNTFTQLNPDGSVTPGVVGPTTRTVGREEKVAEQLSDLLRSDSKFIQDARRQGLEQANAVGGLGGTAAIGASMQAAIRTGLPIAQTDAEAFRAAAAQNMDALNQFAQLNHQRTTQLELGQIDARTRQLTTQITTSAQMAAAQLESATQRDLGRMDSETKLRLQEMQGQIQDRLAAQQFRYNALLNDAQYAAELAKTQMQGEYGLAGTGLAGQWDKAIQEATAAQQKEATYLQLMTGAYDGYLNRLAELNGIEMDDAARQRAIQSITAGTQAMFDLLSSLFPDVPPITFDMG